MLILGSITKGEQQIGGCFRNCNGRFIYAEIAWDFGLYSIMEAETLALKEIL